MERFVAAVLAGLMDGAAFGLIALGIVLVYKSTRVLNFAQAEIGTIAIYVVWELTVLGVPVYLALAVSLLCAFAMGAGLEMIVRPVAQSPRLTISVLTLGVATMLGFFQFIVFGADPHPSPELVRGELFSVASIPFKSGRVLALIVTAVFGIALYLFFKRTLFGLGVLAAAQDQTALRLMGVPQNRVSLFTWAGGAVLTAIAGVILAPTIGAFHPFYLTLSLPSALAAALVGGLTSLPGAFVGGIAIGVIQNIAKFYWGTGVPGAEYVAIFGALILVLLVRPHGLLGAEA